MGVVLAITAPMLLPTTTPRTRESQKRLKRRAADGPVAGPLLPKGKCAPICPLAINGASRTHGIAQSDAQWGSRGASQIIIADLNEGRPSSSSSPAWPIVHQAAEHGEAATLRHAASNNSVGLPSALL